MRELLATLGVIALASWVLAAAAADSGTAAEETSARARALLERAEALLEGGNRLAALESFDAVAELLAAAPPTETLSPTLSERGQGGRGIALSRLGRFEEAEAPLLHAQAGALERDDAAAAARWSGYLGGSYLYRTGGGDPAADDVGFRRAAAELERAAQLAGRAGDRREEARWARQLGRCQRLAGDPRDAIRAYEWALPLLAEPMAIARTHGDLGMLYEDVADYANAERHLREALRRSRGVDDARRVARLASRLGGLLAFLGDLDAAEALLGEARELTVRAGAQAKTPAP